MIAPDWFEVVQDLHSDEIVHLYLFPLFPADELIMNELCIAMHQVYDIYHELYRNDENGMGMSKWEQHMRELMFQVIKLHFATGPVDVFLYEMHSILDDMLDLTHGYQNQLLTRLWYEKYF